MPPLFLVVHLLVKVYCNHLAVELLELGGALFDCPEMKASRRPSNQPEEKKQGVATAGNDVLQSRNLLSGNTSVLQLHAGAQER